MVLSKSILITEQHSKREYSIGPELTNFDSDIIREIEDWCTQNKLDVVIKKRYSRSKKYKNGEGVYHTFIFKNLDEAVLFKIKWYE